MVAGIRNEGRNPAMAIIGYHDGHGDARCTEHTDSIRICLPVYATQELHCTYCGDAWKGETEPEATPEETETETPETDARTNACRYCDKGTQVRHADGSHAGHLYPLHARGRYGYRKSGGCHGGKPEAVWDTFADTDDEAFTNAVRQLVG